MPAETVGDAFASLDDATEAEPALPTIAPVDKLEYAGEAPAADHPKPIALELEPLAVSAAFTDEQLESWTWRSSQALRQRPKARRP